MFGSHTPRDSTKRVAAWLLVSDPLLWLKREERERIGVVGILPEVTVMVEVCSTIYIFVHA